MRLSKAWFAAGTLVFLGGLVSACSLLVNLSECEADADCSAKYGAGNTCDAGVCRTPNATELLGGTCLEAVGDIEASNSFNIGVVMPRSGGEEGFGQLVVNAVMLAQDDVNKIGGIGGRKVGLIICDSLSTGEGAVAAANHLVSKAGVQVVIGSDSSGQTINIANDVTIPAKVALISPSATTSSISSLTDENLVWRTCPSDDAQAAALVAHVKYTVEGRLQSNFDDVTIWVLGIDGEAYSSGIQDALTAGLPPSFVTSPRFIPQTYPEAWEDWLALESPNLARPDIVVLLGYSEGWLMPAVIDTLHPGGDILYIAPDGIGDPDPNNLPPIDLEGRIFGVSPQNGGSADYSPYLNFAIKYQIKYGESPDGKNFVSHAYDAVMIAALGAAYGGFTGPEIALGMSKISTPGKLEVLGTGDSLAAGFAALLSGQEVDYQGASGPLDLDASGEPTNPSIALYCYKDGDNAEVAVVYEDQKFTPASCIDPVVVEVPDMGMDAADAADAADADMGDAN
jgi:branched-chain amino acid transport system substrate-binding protein